MQKKNLYPNCPFEGRTNQDFGQKGWIGQSEPDRSLNTYVDMMQKTFWV